MNKSLSNVETQTAMMQGEPSPDVLSDFRTNRRVLILAALAVPIGIIGTLVAKA
jgi:hypothetical protein